jgi:hypothetical protein
MTKILLIIFLIYLILPLESFAQSATWHPDVTHRPRMIFTDADTATIINRITNDTLFQELYEDIYLTTSYTPDSRLRRAQITKNAAFVFAINRKPSGDTIIPLNAQERDALKNKVFDGFKNADISVSSFLNFNEWQYRAREIISYCEAYDLLAGANVHLDTLWQNGADRIHEFVGNLYTGASNPLFDANMRYSNQRIIYSAALVAGAITFNHIALASANRQPINWVNLGMFNIDKTLWDHQSIPQVEAGYSESSYYLTYATKYAIPIFTALKNFLGDFTENFSGRNVRNPWFDPKYKILFDTMSKLKLPDGKLTPIENSYLDTMFPELAIMGGIPGNPHYYAWPLSTANKNLLATQLSQIYDIRADYICGAVDFTNPPADWKPTQFLPEAGTVSLRSSWDSSATYMHLSAKHGTARHANLSSPSGHNHADETSFIIFAGGELLALHPGYYDYDHSIDVKWGNSHNLILVDDQGPDSALYINSTEQYVYGVDAFIENFFSHPESDFAEIFTRYQNSNFRRSIMFPRRSYFILTDHVKSHTTRKFTFQIHGNGLESNATYLPNFQNKEAKWLAGDMILKAMVTAQDGSEIFSTVTRKHAPRYQVWEDHSALYVDKNASETNFLSVLYPYKTSESEPLFSEASVTNGTGILIETTEHRDFVGVKRDAGTIEFADSLFNGNPIASDGRLLGNLNIISNPNQYSLFFQEGNYLLVDNDTLFSAKDTVSVYAQFDSLQVLASVLSKNSLPNSIFLKTILVPQSVQGLNITNWALNGYQLQIDFDSSYCEFLIIFSSDTIIADITNPDNSTPHRLRLYQNYPNPFNPSTTIEFNLPQTSDVTLKIFNILGEEVATLVSDRLTAGSYTYDWSRPVEMASGVYLYRLSVEHLSGEAGEYVQTRKMVLMR